MMCTNATIFIGDLPVVDLPELSIDLDEPDLFTVPQFKREPPRAIRASFTCAVPSGPAPVGRPSTAWPCQPPPLVRITQSTRTPTRKPFAATSGKSRAGRQMYGCPKLGTRFWMPAPSKLERRRLRSRIVAFNRAYPPPVVVDRTSFDALLTGHTMTTEPTGATTATLHFEEAQR